MNLLANVDYQLMFKILDTSNFTNGSVPRDGTLNSAGRKQLEEFVKYFRCIKRWAFVFQMQSTMKSSSNEAISTSRVTVKSASILNYTSNTRKTRETSYITLNEITNQQASIQIKLLNVSCTLNFDSKYNYYSQPDLGNLLRTSIEQLKIPYDTLNMLEEGS